MNVYRVLLVTIAGACVFVLSSPSYATPAMDVQFEDLMAQASDLKQSLNLNPNQRLLWQQIEPKMHGILRERQRRREQLQSDLKKGLADSHAELRDLAKKIDVESDLSYQESKQLRELWLTVNDALDDTQRQTVLTLLADHLQRADDESCDVKSSDMPHSRGMGKQRPGGSGANNALPQ